MLDNEKKSLIEHEEIYRHEIASKLRAEFSTISQEAKVIEHSFWKRVYDLLDTNLGLWFLSTIFISGGAAIYQNTQHHFENKQQIKKELITCQFEIANRLHNMSFLIKRAKTIGDVQYALTPVTKALGSVKPEFQNINIASLYFNAYQLTGGKRNDKIANEVKELEEIHFIMQSKNPKDIFQEEDRKKILDLLSELNKFETEQIDAER